MQPREQLADLLGEYGKLIGMPGLSLSKSASCQLTYDNKASIHLDYLSEEGRLMLACVILRLPLDHQAEAYADLMELNLYRQELANGCFALLKEAGLVVLCRQMEVASLDVQTFAEALETLAEAGMLWQDQLTGRFADEDAYRPDAASSSYIRG